MLGAPQAQQPGALVASIAVHVTLNPLPGLYISRACMREPVLWSRLVIMLAASLHVCEPLPTYFIYLRSIIKKMLIDNYI
jgi:hypothetical protein